MDLPVSYSVYPMTERIVATLIPELSDTCLPFAICQAIETAPLGQCYSLFLIVVRKIIGRRIRNAKLMESLMSLVRNYGSDAATGNLFRLFPRILKTYMHTLQRLPTAETISIEVVGETILLTLRNAESDEQTRILEVPNRTDGPFFLPVYLAKHIFALVPHRVRISVRETGATGENTKSTLASILDKLGVADCATRTHRTDTELCSACYAVREVEFLGSHAFFGRRLECRCAVKKTFLYASHRMNFPTVTAGTV